MVSWLLELPDQYLIHRILLIAILLNVLVFRMTVLITVLLYQHQYAYGARNPTTTVDQPGPSRNRHLTPSLCHLPTSLCHLTLSLSHLTTSLCHINDGDEPPDDVGGEWEFKPIGQ